MKHVDIIDLRSSINKLNCVKMGELLTGPSDLDDYNIMVAVVLMYFYINTTKPS